MTWVLEILLHGTEASNQLRGTLRIKPWPCSTDTRNIWVVFLRVSCSTEKFNSQIIPSNALSSKSATRPTFNTYPLQTKPLVVVSVMTVIMPPLGQNEQVYCLGDSTIELS